MLYVNYLTVTVNLTFFLEPSLNVIVAVIVALPAFLAVTLPFEDTVATDFLDYFHVTFLTVAFLPAAYFSFSVYFLPTLTVAFAFAAFGAAAVACLTGAGVGFTEGATVAALTILNEYIYRSCFSLLFAA